MASLVGNIVIIGPSP